jgi:superfamily II DNA or RNA helicase
MLASRRALAVAAAAAGANLPSIHARRAELLKTLAADAAKKLRRAADGRRLADARTRRARLAALREHDLEKYKALIAGHRSERIAQLLAQTDSYLARMHSVMEELAAAAGRRASASSAGAPTTQSNASQPASVLGTGASSPKPGDDQQPVFTTISGPPELSEGLELRPHQLRGLDWLATLHIRGLNGILCDDMGLGKTVQTLALFGWLLERGEPGPFLVVAPLSTLDNWAAEAEKWLPRARTMVYRGPKVLREPLRKRLRHVDFDLCVVSFELVARDATAFKRPLWAYAVVDEGHRMKNRKARLTRTMRDVVRSKHRIVLSGTPLQNDSAELWTLLNFLLPSLFDSAEDFTAWFAAPFSSSPAEDDDEGLTLEERLIVVARLHKVLEPFLLRRRKEDVLADLPPKKEVLLRVPLSAWQKRITSDVTVHHALVSSGPDGITKPRALNNAIMHLRKAAAHPWLCEGAAKAVAAGTGATFTGGDDLASVAARGGTQEMEPAYPMSVCEPRDEVWRVSGKLALIHNILPKLRAFGHRTLIFSQLTSALDVLAQYLSAEGIRYLALDGRTASTERQRLIALFSAPESPYSVFLLSTRAGGLGLNLQAADTVILHDSDWNPAADAQAMDRVYRIGQTRPVLVVRVASASAVETQMLSAAARKLQMAGALLEAGAFAGAGSASGTNTPKPVHHLSRSSHSRTAALSASATPTPTPGATPAGSSYCSPNSTPAHSDDGAVVTDADIEADVDADAEAEAEVEAELSLSGLGFSAADIRESVAAALSPAALDAASALHCHSADEINQAIARSDEEYARFCEMDDEAAIAGAPGLIEDAVPPFLADITIDSDLGSASGPAAAQLTGRTGRTAGPSYAERMGLVAIDGRKLETLIAEEARESRQAQEAGRVTPKIGGKTTLSGAKRAAPEHGSQVSQAEPSSGRSSPQLD